MLGPRGRAPACGFAFSPCLQTPGPGKIGDAAVRFPRLLPRGGNSRASPHGRVPGSPPPPPPRPRVSHSPHSPHGPCVQENSQPDHSGCNSCCLRIGWDLYWDPVSVAGNSWNRIEKRTWPVFRLVFRLQDEDRMENTPMSHGEFLKRRQAGTIAAGIDQSDALRLVDHLPKRYQAAHFFWSWIWMLSIPGFICVSVFWKWWAGILMLFFITPMIFKATKQSAAQFVLDYAEESEEFFKQLVANNLLTFKDTC